jgi:epoxyqueuosine reductase
MFYMGLGDMWRWKMNVARAMGNTLDPKFVPELVKAYNENNDSRIKCMIAWALGRIGSPDAVEALENFLNASEGQVKGEITLALNSKKK